MRRPWRLAGIWDALRKNWHAPSQRFGQHQRGPQLFIKQLEERRVLTAAVNTVIIAPAVLASMTEGAALSLEPGAASESGGHGSDIGSDHGVDSGNNPPPATAAHDGASDVDSQVGSDAGSHIASEISANSATSSSETNPATVVTPPQADAQAGLTLTVASDQSIDEGALLSITDLGSFTDSVGEGNEPPVGSAIVGEGTYTFTINWGDGTVASTGTATIDTPGTQGAPITGSFDGSHTYADNGVYTVTVMLSRDGTETTASGTFAVTVENVTPTLTVVSDQTVAEGSPLSLTDIGTFTDPGFDNPLNVDGETSEKFTYAVDWGDGTDVDAGPATIDVHGSAGVHTAGSFDGSHTYADNGVYTVTVTLSDDDGGSTSATFLVTVNNVAPTLQVPANQTIDEGSLLSLPDIGKFTDPGFDNPLNVGGETTERFTYAVDWGDGTDVDAGPATIDVPGSAGVHTAGSFDGSHTYADNGVYTVTVTLSDDDGGSTSATFLVTVNNVAPTLQVPQNQTIDEGSLLSLPDIGKFTDPGFDNPLNVGGETTERFTYAVDWGDGTDVDAGPATIDVHGSAGVLTSGSFDGSHTYADNGVYTVTVTLSDDDGGSTSATFLVTVNNVAPTLQVPQNQTIDEGSLLSLPDIGKFTDPGFDNPLNVGGETTERFTYAVDWGDGSDLVAGPGPIDTPGSIGVRTAGSFDGSHTYADNGVYTVTVTLSDDDGGTTTATFLVTVNNVAPSVVVPPNQTIDEGSLLSLTDLGKFTDPGFDNPNNVGGPTSETFTRSIDWGDGTPAVTVAAPVSQLGSEGVLTAGSFDGSHTYADNGVYTVTVTVSDDDGGVTMTTFQVTVNNVAPTLAVPGDQTVGRNAPLSITDIGKFTDPGFDNPLNVNGETTERFTFAVDWGDGTDVDSGPGPISTPGAAGLRTAGEFNGQHVYANGGIYTVTVTISDDDGGTASGTFLVYVGPTLTVPGSRTIDEGSQLTIADIGQFVDPAPATVRPNNNDPSAPYAFTINWGDGTPLDAGSPTVGVPGAPNAFAGAFNGGHIYADNGLYTVVVTVTSPDGRVDTSTIVVTVNNVAPSLIVVGDQTVAQTRPLTLADIGKFSDPGFDNLLDVGGETTERFTFTINWGDGTRIDTGPGNITQPGHANLLTAGAFNGQHTFAASGTFTVTVTVSDDDGGSARATFQVTVASLVPQNLIFLPPGGGGGSPFQRPEAILAEARPLAPQQTTRADIVRYRAASVAGAETRLVLRIVMPSGIEDKNHDEPLANEVLDNLRKLFKRLPDGHYRIYQIQPDGVERLVIDVIVRQGRSIDAADEIEDSGDMAPRQPPAPVQPANQSQAPQEDESSGQDDTEGSDVARLAGPMLALGGGYVVYSAPSRRALRIARGARPNKSRRLSKVSRLLERLR